MASLALVVRRSTAGIADQAAPAAAPASPSSTSVGTCGRLPSSANDMPTAPIAPITIWPWPPMLNRPARAGTTTASAPNSNGAVRISVSPMPVESPNAASHMAWSASTGSAPLTARKAA